MKKKQNKMFLRIWLVVIFFNSNSNSNNVNLFKEFFENTKMSQML